MYLINSYRIQVFLLLATIAVGIYTIFAMADDPEPAGSIATYDGLIINQINNTPFTGKIVDTVANKVITFDVKNGIKNGEFIIHDMKGNKSITGNIINNKNEGKWSYYYSSGELESEGFFKNDITVDKWIWYHKNGKVMEEGMYVDGQRDGVWKLYNENGNLKKVVFFNKGNIVSSFDTKHSVAS